MKDYKRPLIALFFAMVLPLAVYADAPVIDESDNFSIVEEQQADMDAPLAKSQIDDADVKDEDAFAIDEQEQYKPQLSSSQNASLVEAIQRLQQEVQELRGQLEVQSHELKVLKEQQISFYKDLDGRLNQDSPVDQTKKATALDLVPSQQALDEKKPELIAPKLPVRSSRNNPADEQISYLAAYDLVKSKRFDDAIKAMQAFTNQYPQGGYTANAHYWLGELFLVKNNYQQAIEHFEIVLNTFPSSSKSAASLLKTGYALAASGKTDEARSRLMKVIKNYPDTQTAQLARSKLELLDSL